MSTVTRPRPKGLVSFSVTRQNGELLYNCERKNLWVNAGMPALAALLAGVSGWDAAAIGFGSGTAAPTVNDIALTAPAYYKALASASDDGNGNVTFSWSLTTSDTGAQGLAIGELGLFANHSTVSLPGANAPAPMLAHVAIQVINFTSGMNLSGTWTISF